MSAQSDARKVMGWWVLVFLGLATLSLLSRKAGGQQVHITRAPLFVGYGAVTTCDQDNNIVVIVSPLAQDTTVALTHEMVHVAQMKRHEGGCKGYMIHFRADPVWKMSQEAEAYCSGYETQVANGLPKENIIFLVMYLRRSFAPALSDEEVRRYVPCGRDVIIAARDGTYTTP